MTEEPPIYRVWVEVTEAGWLDVDAWNKEEAEKIAFEAVSEGSQAEWEDAWAETSRAFLKDAPCELQDAAAKTPWCRLHDSPMRPDKPSECYDAAQHRERV